MSAIPFAWGNQAIWFPFRPLIIFNWQIAIQRTSWAQPFTEMKLGDARVRLKLMSDSDWSSSVTGNLGKTKMSFCLP